MALVLSATNETLQVVLGAAASGSQLQCVAHWADENGTFFLEDVSFTNTNDTTAVTLVAAPAANTRRLISDWTINNTSTSVNTVTVQLDVGGTPYVLYSLSLPVGSTLNSDGTVVGEQSWFDKYPPSATDPVGPASEGEHYFNTALDTMMQYDAGRSKWLSMESAIIQFGRNGNVPAGSYYRAINGATMSATIGYTAYFNGTIVSLGYTRSDTDAATFDVVEGGVSRATLASAAVSGVDNTLDGDFSAGGVLSVLNQAGGNTTSNVQGWVRVKWRA
jgi:hypothetical protein